MFKKLRPVFCVGALLLLASGCPFMGLEYEEDLVGDYAVWATDTIEDTAVVRKDKNGSGATGVIPAMVFAYGWNDSFIIAKQHPTKDHWSVDTGTTNWYIIQVKMGKVHGPLTESEFNQRRTELQVPSELQFTRTIKGSIRRTKP